MWTLATLIGLTVARADPGPPAPMVTVQGYGAVGPEVDTDDVDPVGAGGGMIAGVRVVGPLWAELLVEGGWRQGGGGRVAAAAGLRAYLANRDVGRVHPSIAAGVGVDALPGADLFLHAGLDLDIVVHPAWALRVGAGVSARGWEPDAGRVVLGFRWSPPKRPEPEPEPEPQTWLPYDTCAFVDEETARTYVQGVRDARAAAIAEALGLDPTDPSVTRQGALVVVARPGDLAAVGEMTLEPVREDGLWVSRGAPGALVVRVVGGGRESTIDAALVDDQVQWIVAPAPSDRRLTFDQAAADLREAATAWIAEAAPRIGGWSVHLWGSFSPEGDERANRALAQARAEAVADALVAAGVPASQVTVEGVELPAEGLPPEEQRAVRVSMVAEGGAVPDEGPPADDPETAPETDAEGTP